jgi:hypothetical protein
LGVPPELPTTATTSSVTFTIAIAIASITSAALIRTGRWAVASNVRTPASNADIGTRSHSFLMLRTECEGCQTGHRGHGYISRDGEGWANGGENGCNSEDTGHSEVSHEQMIFRLHIKYIQLKVNIKRTIIPSSPPVFGFDATPPKLFPPSQGGTKQRPELVGHPDLTPP